MGKKSGGRVRVKQVGPKTPVNPLEALAIPPEEMINFPPKPDTNISHVWPLSAWCLTWLFVVAESLDALILTCHYHFVLDETFTMDYKQFSVIYPTYMDADKTVKQGRRIAAKDAVPNPTVIDIGQALQVSQKGC